MEIFGCDVMWNGVDREEISYEYKREEETERYDMIPRKSETKSVYSREKERGVERVSER